MLVAYPHKVQANRALCSLLWRTVFTPGLRLIFRMSSYISMWLSGMWKKNKKEGVGRVVALHHKPYQSHHNTCLDVVEFLVLF